MTPEERSQIDKIKPPQDVIDELAGMVSDVNPHEKIKELFYTILKEPYLDGFKDISERCRNASKIVLATLASHPSLPIEVIEIQVFDKTSIKEIEKKDHTKQYLSEVFSIGCLAKPDSKPRFCCLQIWGEATKYSNLFEPGKAYRLKVGLSDEYDQYFEFSVFNPEQLMSKEGKSLLEPIEAKLPSPIENIRSFFKEVQIHEAELNISENNELKLLRGRVVSGRISLSKKGKNMGFLNLINPTKPLKEIIEQKPGTGILVIFSDAPEFATRHGPGSDILVLGEITKDDDYGIGAFGKVIVPILSIPPPAPKLADTSILTSGTNPLVKW